MLPVNTPAVAPMFPTLALPVTLSAPAVVRLPPETLPVAATTPPVVKLPPVTLPVATINPAVPKLPTLALPLAFSVPATFTPVLVITNSVVPPAAVTLTLPLAVIVILLLPFCNSPLLIVVILPVVITAVVVPILPTLALPTTFNNAVVKLPVNALNEIALFANCATFPVKLLVSTG